MSDLEAMSDGRPSGEASRMHFIRFLDSVGRDLRFALRALRLRPSFTLAAVLTLALGIGATTAIFSVVYSVLIKPLPYPNPDELVSVDHSDSNGLDYAVNSNMYLTYRDENRTFADIGLWQEGDATLASNGEPQRVRALRVSHGTLQALGVRPTRGRWFTAEEHEVATEGPAPVILSYGFWQRQLGGDEGALGLEISIDSQPSQVVGIMPSEFRFLDMTPAPDVILAVRLDPARQFHGIYQYEMLARLEPGATPADASADIERMLPIWIDAWPIMPGVTQSREDIANLDIGPVIRPLKADLVGSVASMLWVLMGAVGAVLLIACANIANLMLVRADARRQDFAVRAALGAATARIARELLVESLCLGATGSVLGLLLAYVGLNVLVANGPSSLPRLEEVAVYPPVLVFTLAVSLASTLLFGSFTAFRHALHTGTAVTGLTRSASVDRERSRTRSALVVVQVALALVLVVSAVLMIRTFQALRDVDLGFSDPATIQTARIWIPTTLFPDAVQYTRMQREILDRVAVLPGVTAVGFASAVAMEAYGMDSFLAVEGETSRDSMAAQRNAFVSPGYFEATGTRMVAGRDMTWNDIEAGGRVALISENLARELGVAPADAVGRRIRLGPFSEDPWHEVIGVVQDVHQDGLYADAPRFVYWPVLRDSMFNSSLRDAPPLGTSAVTFAIRSERAGTSGLMNEVRQAVSSVSGSIPVAQARTMQELYADSLARTSFALVMLAIAGGMALALGVIGIYAVIAYVVSQRIREIGIRSALGAEPRQLEKMFLIQGLALSGAGAVIGLAAAVALGRSMSSLLFGIGPMDPAAYGSAFGIIVLAAVLASYLPARRAATIDPAETLRAE
jgi:predicted permease